MLTLCDCGAQSENFVGDLGIRTAHLRAVGDRVDGHTHHFDHTMFFAQGTARVRATCDEGCDETLTVTGPVFFLMKKHWRHEVEALTPDVKFWCVWSGFDANGKRVGDFTTESE